MFSTLDANLFLRRQAKHLTSVSSKKKSFASKFEKEVIECSGFWETVSRHEEKKKKSKEVYRRIMVGRGHVCQET